MQIPYVFLYGRCAALLKMRPGRTSRAHVDGNRENPFEAFMKTFFPMPRHVTDQLNRRKARHVSHWVLSCVLLLASPLIFIGCAHISFHDPTNPSRNVGLEYYKLKLYLLVTNTPTGPKSEILTLPDLTQPRYALLHPGYGSSNLSIKLTNGIITEVGQAVDTKIPETITALANLATAAKARETETGEPNFGLYEMVICNGQVKLKKVDFTTCQR